MTIRSILNYAYEDIPFPAVIDNSMLSEFRKCETAGYYSYLENLSPVGVSVHLHAGGAFAHGIEHARRAFYEQGRPAEEAIAAGCTELLAYYGDYECPPESPKSAYRMAGALEFYFSVYRLGSDYLVPWTDGQGSGIEFSFSLPMSIRHPVSGEPILYVGRFDMLGRNQRDDNRYIVDEKTATSLGAQWTKQWELDSQFTGYFAGAAMYNKPVAGGVIRGVSILKTKYDTQEAIIHRPQWQIERWWREVHRSVARMVEIWQNGQGEARIQLDKSACGAYGGCKFTSLCSVPNPTQWKKINFEPRVWHPQLREEREAELLAEKEARHG